MCGICGQYNFRTGAPVLEEELRRMSRSMVHRGPDDEGHFLSGALGLGFRRLSIIDLGGGHQPMSDRQEAVWVVFNGEIYNFRELKEELQGHGHEFRTRSDTEVIVHGYKQWGDEVLGRLKGMFGLAVWDDKRKRLVIARDAMGIKLVYYQECQDGLLFGSEMRPILALQSERPALDAASLNLFLRYRYTPSPRTLYRGIRKLAPGAMLVVEDGRLSVRHWYRYRPQPFESGLREAEAREELLRLYKQAIERHLISDVPLGLLLSGGVDSGLLLGLMNLYGERWPTFTVGYGESYRDDELKDAEKTAAIFSSRHTVVHLTRRIFEDALPKVIDYLEEPVATSSVIPMYFVCQRARQDVKVALIGQGPDELFGGYKRHLGVRYGCYWRRLPPWLRAALEHSLRRLPRNEAVKRGMNSLGETERMRRFQQVFSLLPGERVNALFRAGVLDGDPGDLILESWRWMEELVQDLDELGAFQFVELRSSLPDELLMYADKLSMAHGLEVRVPYLDKDITEFVERLPQSFKVRWGERKRIHKSLCREYLPPGFTRRKKRGFGVNVVDQWFDEKIEGKTRDYLLDGASLMYEYLDPERVQGLFREHSRKVNDNHKILFSLVVFEEWLRNQKQTFARGAPGQEGGPAPTPAVSGGARAGGSPGSGGRA